MEELFTIVFGITNSELGEVWAKHYYLTVTFATSYTTSTRNAEI